MKQFHLTIVLAMCIASTGCSQFKPFRSESVIGDPFDSKSARTTLDTTTMTAQEAVDAGYACAGNCDQKPGQTSLNAEAPLPPLDDFVQGTREDLNTMQHRQKQQLASARQSIPNVEMLQNDIQQTTADLSAAFNPFEDDAPKFEGTANPAAEFQRAESRLPMPPPLPAALEMQRPPQENVVQVAAEFEDPSAGVVNAAWEVQSAAPPPTGTSIPTVSGYRGTSADRSYDDQPGSFGGAWNDKATSSHSSTSTTTSVPTSNDTDFEDLRPFKPATENMNSGWRPAATGASDMAETF